MTYAGCSVPNDSTHEAHGKCSCNLEQVFNTLGYIDIQNISKRIKAKTFMACGLMDQICPPSSQHAAYNKISAEKDIVYYPDFAHERLPGWADKVHQFILSHIDY